MVVSCPAPGTERERDRDLVERLQAFQQKLLQKEATGLFEQSESASEATLSEEAVARLAAIETETSNIRAEIQRIERPLERERDLAARP